MIRVTARVHPFAPAQREVCEFAAGSTIQDIVTALVPVEVGRVIIMVDGEECTDRETVPADESLVTVSVVPAGSSDELESAGEKTIGWSLVLGLGVMFVGLVTLNPWTVLEGAGILLGGIATGAQLYKLSKAMDIPGSESTLSIAGGRNTMAPWGKVPVVIGKHRLSPHYAAGAYTYVSGTDGETQYLRQLFCFGAGPLKVTQIKLGDTLLASNSGDVRNGNITPGGNYSGVTIQIQQNGSLPSTYSQLVTQDEIGAKLKYNAVVWRTTPKNAVNATVSVSVAGLYKTDGSKLIDHSVSVQARYRTAGTSTAWGSCPVLGTLSITRSRSKLLRFEISGSLGGGQYEIGVMRTSADDPEDFKGASETQWANLRTVRNVPPVSASMRTKVVLLAVTIKATDQLNGAIENLNAICESVEHVYSGGNWASTVVTRNPASHIIEGLVYGRFLNDPVPSSKIDWAAFNSWYTLCASKSWSCDRVVADSSTLQDLCNRIAQTGRAYITLRDGLYSVVVDEARTTPVQHFTPRNVRSFAWTKAFSDLPHGFRLGFISANDGYQTSERLCLFDEYTPSTATKLERLDLWGITDASQAWKHGRYLLACRRLRPEAYTFETDVEGIVCEPGDLVLVSHDSIAVGIVSGRIKALTADGGGAITAVEIDEEIEVEAGVTYGVQIRAVGGYYYRTVTVDGRELTLSSSIPAGVLAMGDLYTIGEAGTETMRCVVSSIEAGQDFGLRITCLDEAPGVHTADSGSIPEYEPLIDRAGQNTMVDIDLESVIVDMRGRVDESLLPFDATPENVASLESVAGRDGLTLSAIPGGTPGLNNTVRAYIYELSRNSGTDWSLLGEAGAQAFFSFDRVVDGYPSLAVLASYRVRVKARSVAGVLSDDWTEAAVDTSAYLGWTPTAPSAGIRASNRAITLGWQAQNDTCYGDLKYEIQVCKAIQADGSDTPADRELAASWRGPSSVDIYGLSSTFEALLAGNDPADEGYKYRYGDKTDAWGGAAESVVAVTGSAYVHALPLDQEVVVVTRDTGNYLSTVALDTLYYYRIRAVSFDGETLVQSGAWCAEISAMAAASSALDVVRNMLNTATIVDGSIVAEKLFVEMLSAITANMGQITDGALVGNENNYWILTTGEYGGVTRYAGDFRVGTEAGDYFECKWNPTLVKYEIDLKASSFRITALGTEIDGELIVTNAADPTRRCRVTSAGPIWEKLNGGVWVSTGEMTQDLLGNLTLTNDPGNAPTPLIEPPSVDSVYYHFDEDMLDQNGENGADITATGTLTAPTVVRGKCIAGTVSKKVGEDSYVEASGDSIVISSVARSRLASVIVNDILYLPIDGGTGLERYNRKTKEVLPEITLSTSNRYRRDCAVSGSIIYITARNTLPPNETFLEMYNTETGVVSEEMLTETSSQSNYILIVDEIVYAIPSSSTNIMFRYDIQNAVVMSEITLVAGGGGVARPCHADGVIYIPSHSVGLLRYDIGTESMLPPVNIGTIIKSGAVYYDGHVYVPLNGRTVMYAYEIASGAVTTIAISASNRGRNQSVIKGTILYTPISAVGSTVFERYDLASGVVLSDISIEPVESISNYGYSLSDDGVFYLLCRGDLNNNSTRIETHGYFTLTLPPFSTLAAWFKGSITLPGNVEIFADSSAWYYVLLSTSGSEITYTVYALDGTEVLSDSYDYVGRYATPPSTDILITGHIDELIYDANTALDPTIAIESKLPWGYGLDASKTWLVLHAKDPAAVSSNAFLTKRNPAALGEFSVRDLDDEEDWFSVGADEIVSHKPHRPIKGQVYRSSLTGGTVSHTIYHAGSGSASTAWTHIANMPFPTSGTHDILRIQMTGGAWSGTKGQRIIALTARDTIAASYLGTAIPNVSIEIYNNGSSYDVYIKASTTYMSVIAEVTAFQSALGTGVIRTTTPPGTLAWSTS